MNGKIGFDISSLVINEDVNPRGKSWKNLK